MLNTNKKFIIYLVVMIFLSLGLSVSFQSLLALSLSPTANPPQKNIFRRNVMINEGTNFSNVVLNAPLGVRGDFQVGPSALFISYGENKVSIGSIDPKTTLDVNGVVKVGNYPTSGRPTCDSDLIGSIFYDNTVNKPFVCTNTGWLFF